MTLAPNHHTPGAVSDEGYHKDLGRRQIQMIAVGGAIGTGLFLGAGHRLASAGPSLAIVYLICGFFSFLILRALGELVMYRPSSGSFVSYAREFLGERWAYVAGWMSFLNWAMTGIVDITAVALYMHYWAPMGAVPQWVFALAALFIVVTMNMIGVRYFGEMEFWFCLIKVVALVLFLVIGAAILGFHVPVDGAVPGLHLVTQNGGMFPHGIAPALFLLQGVVFAYSGIELIGTAAGESEDPRGILPRAINSVIWRIGLFYVCSVGLLVCLLPWTAYRSGVSPFVTFLQALGVPGVGSVMNVVVLTAALSSLNSGLYATGRILRAMALGDSAPRGLARMNRQSVPYVGILATAAVYLVGVGLNYVIPSEVFEIVLNVSALGILSTWAFILVCQLKLRACIDRGDVPPTGFAMPWAPFSTWATLGFLAFVVVMMGCDYPEGTYTLIAIPFIAAVLALGWALLRPRRLARGHDKAFSTQEQQS